MSEPPTEAGIERRKLLATAAAAGTIAWSAPAIIGLSSAAASASVAVLVRATSGLWKWNANPPTVDSVCSTGPTGNASRGSAEFVVNCSAVPPTVSVTITVTSGPALSGANAREVKILQSTTVGCSLQTSMGMYDSANNQPVTFGPTPVLAGTTHFSMVMLQTGGGGTDTYTTNRVNLTC